MVKQYPYMLQKLILPESERDSQGNYLAIEDNWCNVMPCRDEMGKGKRIENVDGQVITSTYLIQCPKKQNSIVLGDMVRVVNGSQVRLVGQAIFVGFKNKFYRCPSCKGAGLEVSKD
jgi:hypothetical protein